MKTLHDLTEFGCPFRVHTDGTVTQEHGIYAPCSVEDEMVEGPWELLKGYTGQDSYHGPVMHPSEYLGGILERDILATPGVYCLLEAYSSPEEGEEESEEASGWCVARYTEKETCPSVWENYACKEPFGHEGEHISEAGPTWEDEWKFLADTLEEVRANPRYSHEDERTNFFHALSMDSSCYEEETGDACDWVRHAVLFRFSVDEAAFLLKEEIIERNELQGDETLVLGFSVDDCGFPSVISPDEYANIDKAYSEMLEEQEAEEEDSSEDESEDEEEPSVLCEACNAEKFSDDRLCNGNVCAKSTFEKTKTLKASVVDAFLCQGCGQTDSEPVRMPSGADWCKGCANEAGFDVEDYSGYVYKAEGK